MTKEDLRKQNLRLRYYLKKFIMKEIEYQVIHRYWFDRPPDRTPFMTKAFMDKRQKAWKEGITVTEQNRIKYRQELIDKYKDLGLL